MIAIDTPRSPLAATVLIVVRLIAQPRAAEAQNGACALRFGRAHEESRSFGARVRLARPPAEVIHAVEELGGDGRRPVGRPPRIDRRKIADAALAIGLDGVTMKSVAERLGVSVPGLYHHVRNKQELLRLAAHHSMEQLDLPADRGQPWTEWLMEYAEYVYRALTDEPELVNQLLGGGLSPDREVETIERVLSVLERHGFSLREALDAYRVVSQAVVGAAVSKINREAASAAGRPALAELHRALSRHDPGDLPHVRRALAAADMSGGDPLHAVEAAVAGIAARRGDEPSRRKPARRRRSRSRS